jgi:hypothetical protein
MDDEMLPAGALIEVTIQIRVPVAASHEHIREWLVYNCLQSGGIGPSNPLYHAEPEGFGQYPLVFHYGGMTGRLEEFDHEDRGDGCKYYKVRYIRERAARTEFVERK